MKLKIFTALFFLCSFTFISAQMTVELSLTGTNPVPEDGGTIDVTATITSGGPTDDEFTVTITWSGETGDVTGEADITIASGTSSGSVTITGTADTFLEGDETVTATIAGFTGYTGAQGPVSAGGSPATLTITDAEEIILVASTSPIAEDGGTVDFTAEISGSGTNETGGTITVNLDWTAGTATAGTDFTGHPISTTIANTASSSAAITITSSADTFLEGDETIGVDISSLSGAPTGTNSSSITTTSTITDAEFIEIVASTSPIAEDGGTVDFTAQVSNSGTNETGGTITVNLDWTAGTATAGTDFSGHPASTTIANTASSSAAMTITSSADTFLEGDETIGVDISSLSGAPGGAGFTSGTATSTITDAEEIILVASTSPIAEDGGTVDFTAEISGSGTNETGGTITVNLDWTAGTATAGTDFSGHPASTTIANTASSSAAMTITSSADTFLEGDETIGVDISSLSGAPTGTNSSSSTTTSTITDAESIVLSGGGSFVEDGPSASTGTLTATVSSGGTVGLSGSGSLTIDIAYGGTATESGAGDDYNASATIVMADGDDTESITLTPISDVDLEGDETITATASTVTTGVSFSGSPQNYTLTDYEKPTLSTPTDGATGQDLNPTLTWAAVSQADDYNLEVNTASDFTGTVIYSADVGNVTSFQLNSPAATIEDNTQYFWRITAENTGASAFSELSDVFDFTTIQQTLDTFSDGSAGVTISPTLIWDALTGADEYFLEVNTASDFTGTSAFSGTVSGTSQAIGPLDYNTEYFWRVTGRNLTKVNTSTVWDFKTQLDPIGSISTPTTGADRPITGNTISFDYDDTGSASDATILVRYRIDGGSWVNLHNTSYSADVSISETIPSLPYQSDIDWEYSVTNDDNGSDVQTGSGSFRTLLANPVLVSPTSGTRTTDRTPTFDWTQAASTDDIRYDIIWEYNEAGSDTETTGVATNATTEYTPASDLPLGKYEWDIEANDTKGSANGTNTATTASNARFTLEIVPDLAFPINGLTGVALQPHVYWRDGGVSEYIVEIATDDAFSSIITTKTVTGGDTSYHFTETDPGMPLSYNTTYYWRVRYTVGAINLISVEWHFTTFPNITVTQNHPANGMEISTKSTQFTWSIQQATGTLLYRIQLAEQDTEPTATEWAAIPASQTDTTRDLSYTFTLSGGSKYWWRIIVLRLEEWTGNASGKVWEEVAYSPNFSLTTTGGTSVTPIPSWPLGDAEVFTNDPTLYWYTLVFDGTLKYQVKYGTSDTDGNSDGEMDAGTKLPLDGDMADSASTSLFKQLSGLTPGTTYYWQVRVWDPATTTFGDWSTIVSFKTKGTGTLVVPNPSYPTGGVTVYTTSPTLYWWLGQSSDGLTFEIDIATSSTGIDGTADSTGITVLSKLISGLTPGETYEWAVRSNNGSSTSAWSSTETFTIAGGVTTGYPIANWPIGHPTVYTTTPTLSWYLNGSSVGLTGYVVKFDTTDNAGSWDTFSPGAPDAYDGEISIGSISTTTYEFATDLIYGVTYYWAVASTDGVSESIYATGSFTIVGGATITIVQTNPMDGITIYDDSAILSWYVNGSTTGITGYEVIYSRSDVFAGGPPFTVTVTPATQGTSTQRTISSLVPGATYWWRVRAFYSGTTYSPWSSTWSFTINSGAAPVMPLAGSPILGQPINSNNATISWVLPNESESELTYELHYSPNEDVSEPTIIGDLQQTYAEVDNLVEEQYYWKVRSKTAEGEYSDFSPISVFRTDNVVTTVKQVAELPTQFALSQNYPNPFNPETKIKVSIVDPSNVSLKIYNILGQEVRTLVNSEMNPGVFNVTWDGRDNSGVRVTSGIYIYRVVAGDFIETKKMLLLK